MSQFSTIEHAVEAIRKGGIVIVVDDEDRENEGDMILAAECATPEKINFLARYARGLVCMPITEQRSRELALPLMVPQNTCQYGTAFTVSIDLRAKDTSTGISAHDRAATIRAAMDPDTTPDAFARPGHIFPLIAREGGVLRRAGHTEASVDLARMAGLAPAGVLCEVLDEDGSMARLPRLIEVARDLDLPIITIEDLIAYRRRNESLIEHVADTQLPTAYGDFRLRLYREKATGFNHAALIKGTVGNGHATLVRVHSQCFTGDVLASKRCDCGPQLHQSMTQIEREGSGVLLYMRQEGRGIGLENKIRAYALQDEGHDTVEANRLLGFEADLRDYGVGAQMLTDLGVIKMRLLTNNPRKIVGLSAHGLEVLDRVPIEIPANDVNARYLAVKRDKLGHLIENVAAQHVQSKKGDARHAE